MSFMLYSTPFINKCGILNINNGYKLIEFMIQTYLYSNYLLGNKYSHFNSKISVQSINKI